MRMRACMHGCSARAPVRAHAPCNMCTVCDTSAPRWGLAKSLAVGVALVSCMPGGTASNIVAYIAKGDMVRASRSMRVFLCFLCAANSHPLGKPCNTKCETSSLRPLPTAAECDDDDSVNAGGGRHHATAHELAGGERHAPQPGAGHQVSSIQWPQPHLLPTKPTRAAHAPPPISPACARSMPRSPPHPDPRWVPHPRPCAARRARWCRLTPRPCSCPRCSSCWCPCWSVRQSTSTFRR